MKRLAAATAAISVLFMNAFAEDTILRYIFVPHARTENSTGDLVIKALQAIDYSKFAVKMLGGDLAVSTSKDSATLAYCDKIFDIKSVNTLWSVGNHDVESGNKALIKKFTGRDTYYSYARDGIQFLILDTELGATSFSGTSITGAQLDTVKAVCSRITSADTKFLIVLNSRYIWMVNNPDFSQAFKDSNIAASSKSMTTSNFSTDVYPLIKAVKAKGIQPMWFSGDKARCNVNNYIYNKADSIPFYAAKAENSDPDSTNYCICITYTKSKKIQMDYVRFTHVNEWIAKAATPAVTVFAQNAAAGKQALQTRQTAGQKEIALTWRAAADETGVIQVFGVNGELHQSRIFKTNKTMIVSFEKPGVYIAKAVFPGGSRAAKFVVK
jgi:hypothetical protein